MEDIFFFLLMYLFVIIGFTFTSEVLFGSALQSFQDFYVSLIENLKHVGQYFDYPALERS